MPQSGSTSLFFGLVLLIVLQTPGVHNGFACLSNPCVHGVCLDDLNSTYFCYCIDGYTGLQCQTNWNDCWSSPCQNGGTCIDGIASFNCSCPAGYVGDLCEEDFNECESNPCWNNGTCVDGPNGYVCQCIPGFSGVHCEIDIAVCNTTEETRCHNGGVCEEGPGDTFACRCQPGWEGFLCDTETDECMSAPCQNGAVCIDLHANYECACLFGYTGKNCEEVVRICQKNPCKNGALCLIEDNVSVCYCVPDFHGDLCQLQYDECLLGPKCSNGGTCIDGIDNFTCSCPPSLVGTYCECLVLPDNQLDCSYVASTTSSTTTIVYYANATTTSTTFETELTFASEITTETSTITTQVPNTTIESSTVPYCITHPPPTKTPATEVSTITQFTTTSPLVTTITTEAPPVTTSTTATTKMATTTEATTTTTTYEITSEAVSEDVFYTASSPDVTSEEIYSASEIDFTSPILPITTETLLGTSTDDQTATDTEYTTAFESMSTDSFETNFSSFTSELPSTIPVQLSSDYTIPTTVIVKPETTTLTAAASSTETTEVATTEMGLETNRTFPKELTTTTELPSITTFFTDEPTSSTTSTEKASTTEATEPTLSNTIPTVDCTVPDKMCKNGGTCIFTGEGHKCECPFDSEGSYCETKLGIKVAAFNGNSYLSHRLPDTKNISIEFEAKTLSSTGLLFHSHLDMTYMALYVDNGFLMFKFSCGYQTMLLSELKIPVNNGSPMNIKATLEFSKDLNHCDAQIKINDTLSMMGDQMAKIDKFSKPIAWLHLGGVPNDIVNDNVPTGGFVGCMSNLKVAGNKVYIYKDAEDGYEISECSSLACLSNPCKNGASCSSHGDSWTCHCRNGFLGKMCDISICDNNPCLFGGTCIPFSSSGYICLCPYGKHGHFCENDIKITEPYFSSTVRGLSSFIAYHLPEGISQKMDIKFRFTPTMMEQISLLLFIGQSGQHDFYSDHLAVSFVKGYIMLTWNMGSGPRRIFTSQPIEDGARDYLVQVGYESRRAWLSVDNLGNVTGRSPGSSVQLDIMPLLYLGGHDSKNFSTLPHDLPLHTGFSGCIFDVEVQIGTIILPLLGTSNAIGRAVGQCGTTECYEKSCQNGGACLHHGSTFMCLCQDRWYGPLCSSKKNFCDINFTTCSDKSRCVPLLTYYECDCPYGRVGRDCERDANITDISFTGTRSFLTTHRFEIDSSKFNIEMEIRILKDTGMVLFLGRKGSSFICLNVQNGLLELRVHSSRSRIHVKDPLTVRSSKLLLKGVWHKVQFGVFGRKIYLYVDHIINMGVLDHGFMLNLPNDSIHLGGLEDMSNLPMTASSNLPVPYTGCLRHLSVDEKKVPLTVENILDARNILDCDGTPCGGEACLNGGTCWLDSFLNPHCSCVEPYYGNKCQYVPLCTEENCRNGKCHNGTCSCHIGFEGFFCETELEVKTPSFVGQSYLIVQKLGGNKRRNVRDLEIKKLYLNFTTAKNDGLLLWTRREKNYLGLGLEKGFLKIVYSSSTNQKQIVELVPYYKLSDGLWHNLQFTFIPLQLKVDDRVLKLPENQKGFREQTTVSTNGVFFIGGLPSNMSLVRETKGMFPHSFEGCIEAFATNNEKIINDFSPFEGENVRNCKVF